MHPQTTMHPQMNTYKYRNGRLTVKVCAGVISLRFVDLSGKTYEEPGTTLAHEYDACLLPTVGLYTYGRNRWVCLVSYDGSAPASYNLPEYTATDYVREAIALYNEVNVLRAEVGVKHDTCVILQAEQERLERELAHLHAAKRAKRT